MPKHIKSSVFMPHVQGMRGLAILLIVLFHLLPGVCPYGYIGVDVFLVISGYFLIGKQLRTGADFRFFSFLNRKILRIVPPVLILLLLVLLASILLFPARELLKTNYAVMAVLSGWGNQYMHQATDNYFAIDTRLLPVMHLWYIGVLIQSYLFFGIVFLIWKIGKFGERARLSVLAVIGGLSLSVLLLPLPLEWVSEDQYYCTFPRLWEFVLGGILTFLPTQRYRVLRNILALLALLLLICISFCGPGVGETLGSAAIGSKWFVLTGALLGMLMIGTADGGVCDRLLKWKFFQSIGRVSYTIYLVHWPVICFAECIMCRSVNIPLIGQAALVFLLVSAGMWYFVEQRQFRFISTVLLWVCTWGLVGCVSYTDGFCNVIHADVNHLTRKVTRLEPIPTENALHDGTEGLEPQAYMSLNEGENPLHYIGASDKAPNFVLIGDSHANNVAAGMHLIALERGWHGVHLSSYVVPFWGADYAHQTLPKLRFRQNHAFALMHWLKMHPELHYVFIAQRWDTRFYPHCAWGTDTRIEGKEAIEEARSAQLQDFCRQLQEMGKEVLIFTDTPLITCPSPLSVISSHLMYSSAEALPDSLICTRQQYETLNAPILRILKNAEDAGLCTVLHREDVCFKDGDFKAYNGKIAIMADTNHLTQEGSAFSLQDVVELIDSLLNKQSISAGAEKEAL